MRQCTQTQKQRNSAISTRRWHEKGPEHTYGRNRRCDRWIWSGFVGSRRTGFDHKEYLRKQLLFMISILFKWPIKNIPETTLSYSIIFFAFFTRSKYHKKIIAYKSPPPEKTRPKLMTRDPTFCILPYHWMVFSGMILTVYCINNRSAMMSLDLQYITAHWLIIRNIKN